MFWRPSPLVAAEPSWSAKRSLAMPSIGMKTTELTRKADTDPADLGVLGSEQGTHRLECDVGSQQEELDCHQTLRSLLGGVREHPMSCETPDDDQAGDTLHPRIEPEADQRD